MKRPSRRLAIDTRNLMSARDQYRNDMRAHDVPFIEQQMFDVQMHAALATIERLDAMIELMEHVVIEHMCAKEHEAENGKKSTSNSVDELLDGLGKHDTEPKGE